MLMLLCCCWQCCNPADYVSDVANGGQVLIDERTFKLVKHSLSALGTVDENGYNDKQLQQRLQARAAARMQMACAVRCCRYVVSTARLLLGVAVHVMACQHHVFLFHSAQQCVCLQPDLVTMLPWQA
jgi:hypothetical protein